MFSSYNTSVPLRHRRTSGGGPAELSAAHTLFLCQGRVVLLIVRSRHSSAFPHIPSDIARRTRASHAHRACRIVLYLVSRVSLTRHFTSATLLCYPSTSIHAARQMASCRSRTLTRSIVGVASLRRRSQFCSPEVIQHAYRWAWSFISMKREIGIAPMAEPSPKDNE